MPRGNRSDTHADITYWYKCACQKRISLPADVLWGLFVTHSFLPPVWEKWMRDERTPKDVCREARNASVFVTKDSFVSLDTNFNNKINVFKQRWLLYPNKHDVHNQAWKTKNWLVDHIFPMKATRTSFQIVSWSSGFSWKQFSSKCATRVSSLYP